MNKYQLAPYRKGSKITCPACGHKKRLRRYVDVTTGQYLPDHVGLCDRFEQCGYSYSWLDYKREIDDKSDSIISKEQALDVFTKKREGYHTIPKVILKDSLVNSFKDEFSMFIINYFKEYRNVAISVLKEYKVGYANKWGRNATVFWQISATDIRSGKIMAYDRLENDVKRVKVTGKPLLNWIHSYYKDEYKLEQCFFGEHLLIKYPDRIVNIVESEKTAIIATIFYPNYIWLAAGGANGLGDQKMKVLKDRKITLFADKGKAFKTWSKRCDELKKEGFSINMSKMLEKLDYVKDGEDLADLIIKKYKEKL